MLLVVDVGNSNTVLGLYEGERILHNWRVSTLQRTTDEIGLLLLQLFAAERVAVEAVTGVAICCVVPSTLYALEKACRRYLHRTPRVIGSPAEGAASASAPDFGMSVRVENPRELGPDRVVNAFAARAKHDPPFLIVDFGTATTFDAVDADGAYIGGAIAPGLQISADALFSRTARLPRVEVQRPLHAIGNTTVTAMQSGLFWGYVGLVDGIARHIKQELGRDGRRVAGIATGGLSNLIGRSCVEIDEVDEHLTLDGLRIWYERVTR